MSYRRRPQRLTIQSGAAYGAKPVPKNYKSQQTGVWRHSYTASTPNQGNPAALLANEYFLTKMANFNRTFAAGVTDDTPPTPTTSNNYQNASCFNGSKIQKMNAVFRLKNTSATQVATLDIYEIALSFYDAHVWNGLLPANCPVTFDSTTVSPGDNRGTVSAKAMTATIINDNTYRSRKFIQHYMRKVGTVTIGNQDGNNVAEFRVNKIPNKCKRVQTGMFYAYAFHNDTNKNNAATLNLEYSFSEEFEEVPSENRLPYLE